MRLQVHLRSKEEMPGQLTARLAMVPSYDSETPSPLGKVLLLALQIENSKTNVTPNLELQVTVSGGEDIQNPSINDNLACAFLDLR